MEIVEGEATDHVVDIPIVKVYEDLLAEMEKISMSLPLRLPPETGTNEKRCIFKLPRRPKSIYGMFLEPQVVALGPYHHGKRELLNMEELKWRCFAYVIKSRKGKLQECLIQLGQLEMDVRDCYSETLAFSSYDLLQMMVLDGCFILMLFFSVRVNQAVLDQLAIYYNPLDDLDMVKLAKIYGDLLVLENQIPSCVLKTLYTICFDISSRKYSLFVIATNFFGSISVIPDFRKMPNPPEWLHLLDLVRSILIPHYHNKEMLRTNNRPFSPIPCVTRLCSAGITVNPRMADTFLDVKFKNGVIQMPKIILDDSMCSLLVNCVVFEHFCNISKHFSIYVMLLDCLVNTTRDIDYLCDRGVVINFFGTDTEVTQFINNLGKDLIIYKDRGNDDDSFLLDVFENINKYYRKGLNWGKWTSFKSEYFGKPWLLISAFVGFVLLVLTFLQTFYTIYAYYVYPKN